MPFEKGISGNPKGRPTGAKGKVSQAVKLAISETLESRSSQIAKKLDAITDPVKWLECYAKFAVFIIPKHEKLEIANGYEDLTDAELEAEIERTNQEAGNKVIDLQEWEKWQESQLLQA